MDSQRKNTYESRLLTPFILLVLCMLALVASVSGLYRSSAVSHARVADLQVSWEALMEGEVQASDLLATDEAMRGIARPVPAVESAAAWSLAMAVLSVMLLSWLIMAARSVDRERGKDIHDSDRNAMAAMAKMLDEMAPLASGDLDVRATASSGTAGALADTFNYAVGEMQRLAAAQLVTSRAIGACAQTSLDAGSAMEQRCLEQSSHIHRSSNFLLGMSSTASELSAHSTNTTQRLNTISDVAGSGLNTVRTGSRQLQDAQTHAQALLDRLHSLSARIRHVEDTLFQLEDVAQRADVMVLNITLRASAAESQAGADVQPELIIGELTSEVAALVEELSRTIAGVTTNMLHITDDELDAIALVQRVLAVFEGLQQQAGLVKNSLLQIQGEASGMHKDVSIMSAQAVQHASVVSELSNNMDLINQITQDTVAEIRNNADNLDELRKLSIESRQNLSDLNVPDLGSAKKPAVEISPARRAANRAAISG